MEKKTISGTKEWSTTSVNWIRGCAHQCRYCYARANALRFKKIQTPEEWEKESVVWREVEKHRGKSKGVIMAPSSHDITPGNYGASEAVLLALCKAGNNVLIVSKPHAECIESLCCALRDHQTQVLFRFTIGSRHDEVLEYWEPFAPLYRERRAALRFAWEHGFNTSVSVEPMLESADICGLVDDLSCYVRDSIWIGKMNKVGLRVQAKTPQDLDMIRRIVVGQTDRSIRSIYEALKGNPLVKWKESIKTVVGLPLAQEAGEDR